MSSGHLVAVTIDEATLPRGDPAQDHERRVAIHDLVAENSFTPHGLEGGRFCLRLSLVDGRLLFDVRDEAGQPVIAHILSLSPLRRAMKDYHGICASYYDAIRTATHGRIETIDMARRALHDEAARTLTDRLAGKLAIDHATARRLFTLVSALAWRGP